LFANYVVTTNQTWCNKAMVRYNCNYTTFMIGACFDGNMYKSMLTLQVVVNSSKKNIYNSFKYTLPCLISSKKNNQKYSATATNQLDYELQSSVLTTTEGRIQCLEMSSRVTCWPSSFPQQHPGL